MSLKTNYESGFAEFYYSSGNAVLSKIVREFCVQVESSYDGRFQNSYPKIVPRLYEGERTIEIVGEDRPRILKGRS